jgi:hypothetical protein
MKATTMLTPMAGLRAAPSQVYGGIRLVPLLRDQVREEVRLFRRMENTVAVVPLDGLLWFCSPRVRARRDP